jgi:hypothetical protein
MAYRLHIVMHRASDPVARRMLGMWRGNFTASGGLYDMSRVQSRFVERAFAPH